MRPTRYPPLAPPRRAGPLFPGGAIFHLPGRRLPLPPQASDFRLQAEIFRAHTAVFRRQVAVCFRQLNDFIPGMQVFNPGVGIVDGEPTPVPAEVQIQHNTGRAHNAMAIAQRRQLPVFAALQSFPSDGPSVPQPAGAPKKGAVKKRKR